MEASISQSLHPNDNVPDLFPYDSPRKGQDQFLENARECIENRIHLLAHAPTGLGKTAVSLSAALEMTLNDDGFVFFLTSRQSHHNIAIETLKKIWKRRHVGTVDLVGRPDMCLSRRGNGKVPCTESEDCYFLHGKVKEASDRILRQPMHVRESTHMCLKSGCCPHLAAMSALRTADIAICDYNQVFGNAESSLLGRTDRKESETVLIVDEGHNLPGRIMENNTGILTEARIRSAMQLPALASFREDLMALVGIIEDLSAGPNTQVHLIEDDLDSRLRSSCGIDSRGLAGEMASALGEKEYSRNRDLIEPLDLWNRFGDASVRFVDKKARKIVSKLVDPSLVSRPIFEDSRCGLIMSATLHPPEMFADLLGLQARFACYHYESPFPRENRLLLQVGGVSSRFKTRSARTYESVSRKIMDVCTCTPGNVAAFFPSYDFMGKTESFLRDLRIPKRMVIEKREYGRNEKNAILANLGEERNALLMAAINGSFSEGVDFRDNLLSAVIIVGFPLNPPSPEAEAMKQRMEKTFGKKKANLYVNFYPAVSKVLQAAGRAIRSEHDRAAIVLIDDRYFLPSTRAAFPEDFQGVGTNVPDDILECFFSRPI